MHRATLPMGANDGEKGAMENGNGQKPIPRAASAYGWQLKINYCACDEFGNNTNHKK